MEPLSYKHPGKATLTRYYTGLSARVQLNTRFKIIQKTVFS